MQHKAHTQILEKLNIEALNPMQEEAFLAVEHGVNTVILSPTGTGKTLAFLLPLLTTLSQDKDGIQLLILVPSRELAIQIEQVVREMGAGYKVNAVYGGRNFSKDKSELQHAPAILVGTPGRVADHIRRETFSTRTIQSLVLDEFDKSLEVGFEGEMREIIENLPNLERRVLTSATQEAEVPDFVGLRAPVVIDYLDEGVQKLTIKTVISPERDKRSTLLDLIYHIGNASGIIFCNFKSSISTVSDYLTEYGIMHGCFYGGMEQKDRERALIKFRNGTHQIIIATDLAARGLDIPEIDFIIHYELPPRVEEFTHRNGRTARVQASGTAFVLRAAQQRIPDFIPKDNQLILTKQQARDPQYWTTLFISGGRKDKISKGDIAGLFIKQGKLAGDELGVIELKQECAFVGVPLAKKDQLIKDLNNTRLKRKKVRITEI